MQQEQIFLGEVKRRMREILWWSQTRERISTRLKLDLDATCLSLQPKHLGILMTVVPSAATAAICKFYKLNHWSSQPTLPSLRSGPFFIEHWFRLLTYKGPRTITIYSYKKLQVFNWTTKEEPEGKFDTFKPFQKLEKIFPFLISSFPVD